MEEIFRGEGLIARKFPNYEYRSQQVRMAEEIEKCIGEGRSLVVEQCFNPCFNGSLSSTHQKNPVKSDFSPGRQGFAGQILSRNQSLLTWK